ncbi:MAG: cyclic nucleotide-binding domain-containing protein [Planctomycetaceae bacterium]
MTIEKLSPFHIFSGLERDDAQAICSAFKTDTYDPGEDVLHEGASIPALWIILSGECEVFRSCPKNGTYRLAELKAGDVFGEMSFFHPAPHSATVRAVTPLTVGCYGRSDFLKLAEQSPQAAFRVSSNVAAVLSERLRSMDNWICELMSHPDAGHRRDEWQTFRSAVYSNWDF